MDVTPTEVLTFWLDDVGQEGWYREDDALDAQIRDRFGAAWGTAAAGGHDAWTCAPANCLALIVLLDQFPRNMFRGSPRSFATDGKAVEVATGAIRRGHDRRVDLPARQFFYVPLMHSEVLADQERSVRLFLLSFGPGDELDHAKAHRQVIRRFGRFPYRNAALGRVSTADEEAFLAAGGYRVALAEVRG